VRVTLNGLTRLARSCRRLAALKTLCRVQPIEGDRKQRVAIVLSSCHLRHSFGVLGVRPQQIRASPHVPLSPQFCVA